jgi:hypothetical protein
MAGLQVLSAPTNQPTLNPKVQNAPVQPRLASRVVTTPRQPTLAPKVVTQPAQPRFNPQVQNQPEGLGKITSTGTIDNQQPYTPRLSLDEFAERIKQQYPEYADRDNTVLAQAMLAKYPEYADRVFIPSPEQPEEQGTGGLGGFLVGAAKGAGSTLNTISQFGQKALQAITPGHTPTASIDKERLTPRGTAEKVGFGTEQVAEFFIPGGAVSKGTKAIEAATKAAKVPRIIKGAANLAGKVGLEGASAAAVTAAQGKSGSEVKKAAVIGGAFGVVAKGAEKLLQKAPQTAWSSILKRTPTEAAKNPNLPAQAAKTGLAGASRASILAKAQQRIQSIEVALDDILSESKGKIGTLKIAPYLDELRNAYRSVPGEGASLEAIDNVMKDLLKRKSLTLAEANELKRSIYGTISKSYGKGMLDLPAKTEAQKLIAAGLKREIEKVVPEVKSLNEQQAVYIQVKKAIEKTLARTEGKGIGGTGIGIQDLLVGGIGTSAGVATGNPLLGIGLVVAKKTGESTAVLSASSKLINYFNQLSPTKKLLFYNALKGMTVKGGVGVSNSTSQQTAK